VLVVYVTAILCNSSSMDQFFKIRIECWDWEKSGKFQYIGEVFTTIVELKSGKKEYLLTNAKKKNPGILRLMSINSYLKPTFLDYVIYLNSDL